MQAGEAITKLDGYVANETVQARTYSRSGRS